MWVFYAFFFSNFKDEEMENYEPFPRSDFMKKFKQDSRKDGKRPSPDACIIDLLNKQLKVSNIQNPEIFMLLHSLSITISLIFSDGG